MSPPRRIDVCTPMEKGSPAPIVSLPQGWQLCHHHTSLAYPLSEARRELIERVDTEWFLFMDDDVEATAENFVQLIRPLNTGKAKIGAVESNKAVPGIDTSKGRSQGFKIQRAWTGYTIVRTKAALGWNPPRIARYEDEHLRQYVLRNGYSWIREPDCVVIHNIVERGFPGPARYLAADGYGAWYALPFAEKAWMFLKTPLFARRGFSRLRAHIHFLRGMVYGALHQYGFL